MLNLLAVKKKKKKIRIENEVRRMVDHSVCGSEPASEDCNRIRPAYTTGWRAIR